MSKALKFTLTPGKWVGTFTEEYWYERRGLKILAHQTYKKFVPDVIRVTVGWNGVIERKYRSWTYHEWTTPDDEDAAKKRGREWLNEKIKAEYGAYYSSGGKWYEYTEQMFNYSVDSVAGDLGIVKHERSRDQRKLKKEWHQKKIDQP